MDYGQHSQGSPKTSDDALFAGAITEGVGMKPENSNPDVSESLHSDDQSISWQRNPGKIGNKIINFSGDIARNSESVNGPEQFGVITPTMPPGHNIDIQEQDPNEGQNIAIQEYADLRIVGNKIDASVIRKAEDIEKEKLDKNNDAAGYVDAIRDDVYGLSPNVMENSYGPNSAYNEATSSDKIIQFPGSGAASRSMSKRKAA